MRSVGSIRWPHQLVLLALTQTTGSAALSRIPDKSLSSGLLIVITCNGLHLDSIGLKVISFSFLQTVINHECTEYKYFDNNLLNVKWKRGPRCCNVGDLGVGWLSIREIFLRYQEGSTRTVTPPPWRDINLVLVYFWSWERISFLFPSFGHCSLRYPGQWSIGL